MVPAKLTQLLFKTWNPRIAGHDEGLDGLAEDFVWNTNHCGFKQSIKFK